MIGSFLYALASMVLTIAVIQIVGEDEGGIFSFAYSTFGQHMFMVAYFGIRPFQITDTGRISKLIDHCIKSIRSHYALFFFEAHAF